MEKLTKQTIDSLAASFYPTIKAYFESEQGRAEYQKYLDEKVDNAKSADVDNANDDNGNNAA